jgi:hypothetical protein
MLAVIVVLAPPASAQPADKRTFFTFSGPVSIPGVTLPAGRYLFRLVDTTGGSRVVQVLSDDGTKPYAMFFSIPAERIEAASDPEVRFMETPSRTPAAIKTWWYPGERTGYEFIYPKEQARRLAQRKVEPVLTTKAETKTVEETKTAELARIAPSGQETPVAPAPAPIPAPPTGAIQRGEIAAATIPIPEVPVATAGQAAAPAAKAPARGRRRLPRTASSLPLVGLAGLMFLAGAASIRVYRRYRQDA